MFCTNCGKQLGPGTSFCPACGTRITPEPSAPTSETSSGSPSGSSSAGSSSTGSRAPWNTGYVRSARLLRPRSPRVLGGVCAAFAEYYGWDLNLVRILTAFFALFYGIGILAYVACWIIIPEAQYALPPQSR